jgi:hypothetical protein
MAWFGVMARQGWNNSTGHRTERVAAAAALNEPFSIEEVRIAVRALGNNHKSSGMDYVPAEC